VLGANKASPPVIRVSRPRLCYPPFQSSRGIFGTLRQLRCHYSAPRAFTEALLDREALEVFTTDGFEAGEEVLLELSFTGLPGKMVVRGIGESWHAARPRLRVRASGIVLCTGSEWKKLQFLKRVASGEIGVVARRRHIRIPVLVEVRWRLKDERDFHPAPITEISESGALLLCSKARPKSLDEIVIEITPPGSARPMDILAVVRNTEHPEGVGIEFVARDTGGVHRLREVIRRLGEQ